MNRFRTALVSVVAVAACAPSAPRPTPSPESVEIPVSRRDQPVEASRAVTLRRDWTTSVTVEREDSIVLTLPDGTRQVQRQGRTAHFTMTLTPGAVRVKLDDLILRPSMGEAATSAIGTTWNGRVGTSGAITNLQASRSDPLAEEIGNVVRAFLPRLPHGTLEPNTTWSDSSSGSLRVEIFRADENRVSQWKSSSRTTRSGIDVIPVTLHESFEQLGKGSQSGREMTMTAQGRRIGTYFVTLDGRLDGATMHDSVAKFITIADTRQSIPTMQFARITLQYGSPAGRDNR